MPGRWCSLSRLASAVHACSPGRDDVKRGSNVAFRNAAALWRSGVPGTASEPSANPSGGAGALGGLLSPD
eukprot:2215143-Prymnesium_polylepis.1